MMILPVEESLLSSLPYNRISNLKKDDLKIYLDDNHSLLAIKNNDYILGFIALSLSLDEAEIDYIAINKEEEGKGFATILLEDVFSKLKEKGIKSIFLEVRKSNVRAIRFYEKNGFKLYRERKSYYLSPIEDALCYRKELVP